MSTKRKAAPKKPPVKPAPVEIEKTESLDVPPITVAEPLIRCTVSETFKDGAVRNQFLALGYTIEWPADEVREIPVVLFRKCKTSGAKLQVLI